MQHYVGLDVSVKETSVCIVDKAGKVIREVKVATEPVAILAVLTDQALAIERIGLEAGPVSQWLYSALAEAGSPMICVETRHMKAALSAQINKSDRNDARGLDDDIDPGQRALHHGHFERVAAQFFELGMRLGFRSGPN